MTTSLISGSAGFIGSHVADELLAMGHQVVAIDDLSGGFKDNVPSGVTFLKHNICDADYVNTVFQYYKFDYVFHLAAYAAEGLSHFIKHFNYENNLQGSISIINASVNAGTVKRFTFSSSMAVYGNNQVPMREDMIPAPEDSYGIAKYAVEQELKVTRAMFGLPYTIFRPHSVYGERQHYADKFRNVIGIFMNEILLDRPLTIFGTGEQQRAFSYIADVAPVIAHSIEYPEMEGEIFNVGADTPCTINYLAHAVSEAMGVPLRANHLPARYEVFQAFPSHDKIRKYMDLPSPVQLKDGLARMAAWVKEVGGREPTRFEHLDIEKNLPVYWRDYVLQAARK